MFKDIPKPYLLLYSTLLILLICNAVVIFIFDIESSRAFRLASSFIFFLVLISQNILKHKFVLFVLGLMILRDVMVVFYEVSIYKSLSFVISIFIYGLLASSNLKKVGLRLFKPGMIIFAVCLLSLNAFNVYYLSDVVAAGLDNSLQFGLFFLQGAAILILGLIAYLYYTMFKGPGPLIYLYMVLAFILSDLCGLAAYFFEVSPAFYPERILYLTGIALLVHSALDVNRLNEKVELRMEEDLIF